MLIYSIRSVATILVPFKNNFSIIVKVSAAKVDRKFLKTPISYGIRFYSNEASENCSVAYKIKLLFDTLVICFSVKIVRRISIHDSGRNLFRHLRFLQIPPNMNPYLRYALLLQWLLEFFSNLTLLSEKHPFIQKDCAKP